MISGLLVAAGDMFYVLLLAMTVMVAAAAIWPWSRWTSAVG